MQHEKNKPAERKANFIEPLESRTYFDLVPVAVTNVPAGAVGAQHTNAAIIVDLQNTGAAAIRGAYTVTLLVSPDGLIGDATGVGSSGRFLFRLNPGATRAIRVPVGQFPAVAAGDYHVLAQISGPLAGAGDNVAASASTVHISTPFIDLTDSIRLLGPTTLDPGQLYGLSVTVTNNGNAIARGPVQFQLGTSAAADGSNTTVIGTPTRPLILPGGRSENFLFLERVPVGTAPSQFFADVTVDPGDTFGESDTTNNFAVTGTSDTVRDPFDNILGISTGSFNVILGPDRGDSGTLTLDVLTEDSTTGALAGTATDSLGDNFTFAGSISPFGIIKLSTNNTADNVGGTIRAIPVRNGMLDGVFHQSNGDFSTFNLTLPIEPA